MLEYPLEVTGEGYEITTPFAKNPRQVCWLGICTALGE
jgi:hypothetical protein